MRRRAVAAASSLFGEFMLRYQWQAGIGVVASAAMAMAVAALPATPAAAAAGPVSNSPASGTPQLANTGTTQTVRQLVQCGDIMYAVGNFVTINRFTTTYTRNNIFSFSAISPYQVTSWNPNVNGQVNSIAFSGGDCSKAYIGGKFTSVGGVSAKNIAEISTSTGAVITGFRHNANGQVETLAAYNGHILAGGYYTSINNDGGANPYMTSLDATTGADDGFLHLNISGHYHFCNSSGTRCTSNNATRVYNQQFSHSGNLDLVEGDFTSVGGTARRQIFMLNLANSPPTVTGWTSPEWDGSSSSYPYDCWYTEPFYLQAASWSPDDSTVYVATTGYHPYNLSGGSTPRTGLCDALAAFPSTRTPVTHNWINYPGCDSLYSTAADLGAAYAGGHERWSENPDGCDFKGPGAIDDPGMEGVSPATGKDLLTSSGNARYTRSRGKGADDMLITSAGLWIASDSGVTKKDGSFSYSQVCNGVKGHAGICFLPY
jgi:hypothetical protein